MAKWMLLILSPALMGLIYLAWEMWEMWETYIARYKIGDGVLEQPIIRMANPDHVVIVHGAVWYASRGMDYVD